MNDIVSGESDAEKVEATAVAAAGYDASRLNALQHGILCAFHGVAVGG